MSGSVLFLVLLMVGCDYDIMVVIQFLLTKRIYDPGVGKATVYSKAPLSHWNRRSIPNSWLESRDCLISHKFPTSIS
jgi:hypothetical protein